MSSQSDSSLIIEPQPSLAALASSTLLIISHGTEYEVEPYFHLALHLSAIHASSSSSSSSFPSSSITSPSLNHPSPSIVLLFPRHLRPLWAAAMRPNMVWYDLACDLDAVLSRDASAPLLRDPSPSAPLFAALSREIRPHLLPNYLALWDVAQTARPSAPPRLRQTPSPRGPLAVGPAPSRPPSLLLPPRPPASPSPDLPPRRRLLQPPPPSA
jgi:hypothetical protein